MTINIRYNEKEKKCLQNVDFSYFLFFIFSPWEWDTGRIVSYLLGANLKKHDVSSRIAVSPYRRIGDGVLEEGLSAGRGYASLRMSNNIRSCAYMVIWRGHECMCLYGDLARAANPHPIWSRRAVGHSQSAAGQMAQHKSWEYVSSAGVRRQPIHD